MQFITSKLQSVRRRTLRVLIQKVISGFHQLLLQLIGDRAGLTHSSEFRSVSLAGTGGFPFVQTAAAASLNRFERT